MGNMCTPQLSEVPCVKCFVNVWNSPVAVEKFNQYPGMVDNYETARYSNEFGGNVFATIGGHPDGRRRPNPLAR